MITLSQFEESDFTQLINAVPDDRFLLQWAGPKYIYPLDAAQLNETLAKSTGLKPSFAVFKAIKTGVSEPVGHIQRPACPGQEGVGPPYNRLLQPGIFFSLFTVGKRFPTGPPSILKS